MDIDFHWAWTSNGSFLERPKGLFGVVRRRATFIINKTESSNVISAGDHVSIHQCSSHSFLKGKRRKFSIFLFLMTHVPKNRFLIFFTFLTRSLALPYFFLQLAMGAAIFSRILRQKENCICAADHST